MYTDTTSSGTAFYKKVVVNRASVTGDMNGNGVLDKEDATIILKHCSGVQIITDSTMLAKADLNNDNKVDLIDAITLLSNIK